MKKILVIIVLYNGEKWLDRCLGSVRNSKADCIIIDNGSTDSGVEIIRRDYPEFTLVEAGENLGFGKANNIGLEYALENGYDYAYLLNEDAWLIDGTIETLIDAFESPEGAKYGILSPIQMADGCERMDSRFKKHCATLLEESPEKSIVEVKFVMAAHWMLTRKCIETVGGFSPAFYHNGEDDNYIDRARFHGFKTGVVPKAIAVHDREQRPTPRRTAMRLKCLGSVVKISDPGACLPWRLVRQPMELLAMSIYRRSYQVLKFIPTIIADYPKLIKYRKESMQFGAFLQYPSHQ